MLVPTVQFVTAHALQRSNSYDRAVFVATTRYLDSQVIQRTSIVTFFGNSQVLRLPNYLVAASSNTFSSLPEPSAPIRQPSRIRPLPNSVSYNTIPPLVLMRWGCKDAQLFPTKSLISPLDREISFSFRHGNTSRNCIMSGASTLLQMLSNGRLWFRAYHPFGLSRLWCGAHDFLWSEYITNCDQVVFNHNTLHAHTHAQWSFLKPEKSCYCRPRRLVSSQLELQ